jgi:hypothetical protein
VYKRIVGQVAFFVSIVGNAAASTFAIYPTEYKETAVEGALITGNVCSAYDKSICYDVSRFYTWDKDTIRTAEFVIVHSSMRFVRVRFQEGVGAQKIQIDPQLTLGFGVELNLSGGRLLRYEFGGAIGGRVKQSPCVDAFDREYHCQSLSSWADYGKKIFQPKYHYFRLFLEF